MPLAVVAVDEIKVSHGEADPKITSEFALCRDVSRLHWWCHYAPSKRQRMNSEKNQAPQTATIGHSVSDTPTRQSCDAPTERSHANLSTRQLGPRMLVPLGILLAGVLLWLQRGTNVDLPVHFVCMTDDPVLGSCALLSITNRTDDMIVSQGYGYLEAGRSATFAYPVPAGTGSWRAAVLWQPQKVSRFDGFMNELRERVDTARGIPQFHRDLWFPLARFAYSPEIPR